jgi:hypothetical protein
MGRTTHELEIRRDLTPICSTVVPANEPMGRGCPRWCWLGLEFGPSFEGSGLLAGCSVVEAKFALLEKEGKWAFGMPLYRLSVRLAWFQKFLIPLM